MVFFTVYQVFGITDWDKCVEMNILGLFERKYTTIFKNNRYIYLYI